MSKIAIDERELERLKPFLAELADDERRFHEAVADLEKWEAEKIRLKARIDAFQKCLEVLGPDF